MPDLFCVKCGTIAVPEDHIDCYQCDVHCPICEERFCDDCFKHDDYVYKNEEIIMCKNCKRNGHKPTEGDLLDWDLWTKYGIKRYVLLTE